MPSSTSNSERGTNASSDAIEHGPFRHATNVADRAPHGPWVRTWLLAVLLAATTLVALELGLRREGLRPSVRDEAALWAAVRARATGDGRSTVVLLGSSRFQLGLDPAILNDALGTAQVLQLSIDGTSPVPVLKALSEDAAFRGTALVEVTPGGVFGDDPAREAAAHEWIRAYQTRTWLSDIETELRIPFQARSVLLAPGLKNYLFSRALGHAGAAPYVRMRADRHQSADYSRAPQWKRTAPPRLGAKLLDETALATRIDEMARAARLIELRGGRVVFVRMLATGELARLEEAEFPRARTWEVLVGRPGLRGLHVDDFEALRNFDCPDGSHLDFRDVPRFTRELAVALRPHLDAT